MDVDFIINNPDYAGFVGFSSMVKHFFNLEMEKRKKLKKRIIFKLRIMKIILDLYKEVTLRPGNKGYLMCKKNFEENI